jgi:hypothetical protein
MLLLAHDNNLWCLSIVTMSTKIVDTKLSLSPKKPPRHAKENQNYFFSKSTKHHNNTLFLTHPIPWQLLTSKSEIPQNVLLDTFTPLLLWMLYASKRHMIETCSPFIKFSCVGYGVYRIDSVAYNWKLKQYGNQGLVWVKSQLPEETNLWSPMSPISIIHPSGSTPNFFGWTRE